MIKVEFTMKEFMSLRNLINEVIDLEEPNIGIKRELDHPELYWNAVTISEALNRKTV
jgi:hypothetical protein